MITFKTLNGYTVSVNPRYLHQVIVSENYNPAVVVTQDDKFTVEYVTAQQIIQDMTAALSNGN